MLRITQDELRDADAIHLADCLAQQRIGTLPALGWHEVVGRLEEAVVDPLTRSSHAIGRPSLMHTRSKRMGERSFACSMRNRGRWLRTAVCSSIGMLTRPKEIDPFQSARAIELLPPLELAFGPEPVVEVEAVVAAALQIHLVGASPNLLVGGIVEGPGGDRVARRLLDALS
jgi:hypothetical protein